MKSVALFESQSLIRTADKPQLVEAIVEYTNISIMKNLTMYKVRTGTFWMVNLYYIDLHGTTKTHQKIAMAYINVTLKIHGVAAVVFYGFIESHTIKEAAVHKDE